MWLYTAVLLGTVFLVLYKYMTRNFDYWKKQNVFYPKPIPFFGNLLEMANLKKPLPVNLDDLYKAAGDKDFFGIFVFDRPILIVKSSQLAKQILQRDFSNFTDRTIAGATKHPVMSNFLFVQRGQSWKEDRFKLAPVFTSGKLKLMFPLMVNETKKLVDYIDENAHLPEIETKETCAKFSTNVIARCIFSIEANCYKGLNAVFREAGSRMFDFRFLNALRQFGSFFTPKLFEALNINVFDLEVVTLLQGIFSDVVHTRMATPDLKGNDFVDIVLEANRKDGKKHFTEEAMLGQAIMLFSAGFETVSGALAFTLHELCLNPDIQERMRDEINACLEKNNGFTYEMLQDLKYMDMCILEILRKYPVVPFLDRTCINDYKIEGTDVVLKKGMGVYLPVRSLHYDTKYFPNPEKFDPERFADKTKINKDGLYYLPFGEGPRICIGQRFAMMEAKIALVKILTKYRLEKSAKTQDPAIIAVKSFALAAENGLPMKFVPL